VNRIRNAIAAAPLSLTLAAVLALAGCKGSGEPGAVPGATASAASERAGPDAKPGIALTGARLNLPAVSGRPGAVYFTVSNGGDKPATLMAVNLEGAAKAEMHEAMGGRMAAIDKVEIPAHNGIAFAPGGRHVMVFGLADSLKPGGSAELTLSFADGDKISAPVTIHAAGEAAGDSTKDMDMSGH